MDLGVPEGQQEPVLQDLNRPAGSMMIELERALLLIMIVPPPNPPDFIRG